MARRSDPVTVLRVDQSETVRLRLEALTLLAGPGGVSPQAALVKQPALDPATPATSDLDVVLLADVDDLFAERFWPGRSARPVDIIWAPAGLLEAPDGAARYGLVTHRLAAADVVWDRSGRAAGFVDEVRRLAHEQSARAVRIAGYQQMGYAVVREVGVTWDWPALARFWLHIAHAASVASWCDAAGRWCANAYTRPLGHLRSLDQNGAPELHADMIATLGLDAVPETVIEELRRLHRIVSGRFPEPRWPEAMRVSTRYEYRYFVSSRELEWRIAVAEELAGSGRTADAVYWLRFWGYGLGRLPVVHAHAGAGEDASFLRPARAMRPELERLCPEALPPLDRLLGGPLTLDVLRRAVDGAIRFRGATLAAVARAGIEIDEPDWRPYEPPPASGEANHTTQRGGSR